MVFTFTLPLVPLSTEHCKVSMSQLTFQLQHQQSDSEITMPSTPLQTTITLPPDFTISLPCGTRSSGDKLYPVCLLQASSVSQMTDLLTIKMLSPIHVHTPSYHIGTIWHLVPVTGIQTNETTALDITLYLKSITQMPLSIYTYSRLPQVLRDKVKQAYQERVGGMTQSIASLEDVWDRFISGKDVERAGPFGCDLFMEIWGFERSACESYSIVHVA